MEIDNNLTGIASPCLLCYFSLPCHCRLAGAQTRSSVIVDRVGYSSLWHNHAMYSTAVQLW